MMNGQDVLGNNPYDMIGGQEGVRALARAFCEAMDELPSAQTIRAMHRKQLVDVEKKLFAFLSGWLGGPNLYFDTYGTISLDTPHDRFDIGEAERDQWLACMDRALDSIDAPQPVRDTLCKPLRNMADMMRTR